LVRFRFGPRNERLPLRALDRNAPSLTFRFSVSGVIRAIEAASAKERTGGY